MINTRLKFPGQVFRNMTTIISRKHGTLYAQHVVSSGPIFLSFCNKIV